LAARPPDGKLRRLGPLLAVSLIPLLAARVLAQGGPPLVTDDPGTPGNRRWEINVAFLAESRHGERMFETPLIDANYGWGERFQLKLEIPWVVRAGGRESTRNGLGNALLGVKWRFADEEKSGVAIAFYPQAEFNVVSSSAQKGLVEKKAGLLLPLTFAKNLGPLSANLEIGHKLRGDEEPRWFGGLALGREVSECVELLGEVFATTSSRFADTNASWNAGLRWKLGSRVVALLSGGSGIHGTSETPRTHLLVYAGTQLLF